MYEFLFYITAAFAIVLALILTSGGKVDLTGIATIVLAAATFILAYVSHQTLEEMEDEQRAWVSGSLSPSPNTALTFSDKGVEFGVDVKLTNSGRLPGLHVLPRLHLHVFPSDELKYGEIPKPDACKSEKDDPRAADGTLVLPGETPIMKILATSYGKGFRDEQFPRGKEVAIQIIGFIRYMSGDDPKLHYTGLAAMLSTGHYGGRVPPMNFTPGDRVFPSDEIMINDFPFGHYAN